MQNCFFQNYQWGSTLFDQSMIIEKKKIKKKKRLKKSFSPPRSWTFDSLT